MLRKEGHFMFSDSRFTAVHFSLFPDVHSVIYETQQRIIVSPLGFGMENYRLFG